MDRSRYHVNMMGDSKGLPIVEQAIAPYKDGLNKAKKEIEAKIRLGFTMGAISLGISGALLFVNLLILIAIIKTRR